MKMHTSISLIVTTTLLSSLCAARNVKALPDLQVVLSKNTEPLLARFRDYCAKDEVDYVKNVQLKDPCLFCKYDTKSAAGVISKKDKEFLIIDNKYGYDANLYKDAPGVTSMSFFHFLVIPRKHINSAMAIPQPDMVDRMITTFQAWLKEKGAGVVPKSYEIPNGKPLEIKTSPAYHELLGRQYKKIQVGLAEAAKKKTKLQTATIWNNFRSMAELLEEKQPKFEDFALFFHIPPSIWHLHMHVVLRDPQFRRFSISDSDKKSMSAADVKAELERMAKENKKCKRYTGPFGAEKPQLCPGAAAAFPGAVAKLLFEIPSWKYKIPLCIFQPRGKEPPI